MRLECASKLYYIPEISIQHGEIIISRQKALGKFEKFKNLTCYIVMSGSNATCSTNSQQSDLNELQKGPYPVLLVKYVSTATNSLRYPTVRKARHAKVASNPRKSIALRI